MADGRDFAYEDKDLIIILTTMMMTIKKSTEQGPLFHTRPQLPITTESNMNFKL